MKILVVSKNDQILDKIVQEFGKAEILSSITGAIKKIIKHPVWDAVIVDSELIRQHGLFSYEIFKSLLNAQGSENGFEKNIRDIVGFSYIIWFGCNC